MIGRPALMLRQDAVKAPAQQADRAIRQPQDGWNRCVQREVKWPPHPADPEFLAHADHRFQNRRRHVGMLVGVQMRRLDPGIHDTLYLRADFFIRPDLPARERYQEPSYRAWKRLTAEE